MLGEVIERGLICIEHNLGVLRDRSRKGVAAPLITLPKGKEGQTLIPKPPQKEWRSFVSIWGEGGEWSWLSSSQCAYAGPTQSRLENEGPVFLGT